MDEQPSDAAAAETSAGLPPTAALPLIAGIGASAGGLDPLSVLLARLPAESRAAFVVVQHLQADHASHLAELLDRVSAMPVVAITDGLTPAPGTVSVLPPGHEVTLVDGVLRLRPRPSSTGPQSPIDILFRSLAEDCGPRAVGVVLSGTGADGTAGLLAIKAAGGFTFAQDPASAEFRGMPMSAAAAGGADAVMPPEAIADAIYGLTARAASPVPTTTADETSESLRTIFSVMHHSTGVEFSLYRETTVMRRIERRMALRGITDLRVYAETLSSAPEERVALQRDLLIGVTSFFRDPDSFEALSRLAFPALTADRSGKAPLRLWVPGCATGEEAYSILIALDEYQEAQGLRLPVQMFASDISDQAIETARTARYPSSIAADVDDRRLRRYFTRVDDGYQVARALREQCIFSRHNLLDDPPFSRLDLISCRNVLIYLDTVQRAIIPLFHYALRDPGFLVLGHSESAHFPELFTLVEPRFRLYARRSGVRRAGRQAVPSLSRRAAITPPPATPIDEAANHSEPDVERQADMLLLSRYSPPSVLVDESLHVLEIRGRPSPLLALSAGPASLHLVRLIADIGLFREIEAAVRAAAASGQPERREHVTVHHDLLDDHLDVDVVPLGRAGRRAYLITLEPADAAAAAQSTAPLASQLADAERRNVRLSSALALAQQHVIEVIASHTSSAVANQQVTEDALSSNEELQSLAEELETAKEELLSTNEELITVNRDLEARNVALTVARDLGRSIIETVRAPLVVVDEDCIVRNVNASFTRAFGADAASMEGRPLAVGDDGAWDIPQLHGLLQALIADGVPFDEIEIERRPPGGDARTLLVSGRRLAGRAMVLLTLDDITAHRAMEGALQRSEEQRRQAEKMEAVGRLAGGIAHDFNNLLTVVVGYCSLLSQTLSGDPDAREQVTHIEQAAGRAAALTEQLLAFSRRKILQPKVFALNPLLAEFERMLRRLLDERIRIRLDCDPEVGAVRADPAEIGRVVMNLALNARDAMPGGGILTLATAPIVMDEGQAAALGLRPGAYAQLSVADDGIGMDAEARSHLFEPFFTTKDVSRGAGLGLATVLGIVQQSGGAIACESTPGRGTRFDVWLPVASEPSDGGADGDGAARDPACDASGTILVVEDEASVLRLTRALLESRGHTVIEATSGHQALDIVASPVAITVLLTDVVLPDIGGRDLWLRAVATRSSLKVLFMSGHTEDVLLREGIQQGAPFLQKPFTPDELWRKVREVVAAPV
jgi:two-component system CheB/CheR fusion protein